ncbi:MAG: GNVR domain-containing protein [Gammaproteobacteria bacterium]|nr:hypothetical protein [Gammaproteobacteria bacterium]
MQALLEKILDEIKGAWRFRRYALTVAWVICVLGWLVVLSLKDVYQSQARVNVDTRTALRTVVQGLAVEQDVESQLNLVRQSLLGRAHLEKVAKAVGLDANARTPQEMDAVLSGLGERIQIELEPPTVRDPRIPNTLYRITYTDHDRETALKVVDVLLNSFVEGTMGGERSGTKSAELFLREQLAEYGRRLAEAEERLAAFKKENIGLLPGNEGGYFQRLQSEIQEVKRLESALAVALSRREELTRQLSGEAPFVPSDSSLTTSAPGTPAAQDTASRIKETQARLDDLLLRYTDKHPDVIATRETLEQLKERRAQELAALRRGDPSAAALAGASTNPIYQNIQLQLNQLDVEIAALRGQLADHRRNEAELRRLLDTAPEVEAEYTRLTRDYDVTRAQYNALLERLERARLSQDAEQTGVVKFNIVDPPAVGFSPVFPHRPLFIVAVFVVACGAGCAVAYLMHLFKPVFPSARVLADVTGLTVLGTVSRTWMDEWRAQMRRSFLGYTAASGLLFVLLVVLVVAQRPAARFIQGMLG